MKYQFIATTIVLLFFGVAVAPSINTSIVKASTNDDLIEVTTQACGIKGYGDTTVKLTREQYQDLEQYLVEFRARLNTTTTREEAIPFFKEAVIELNKYGLLPKGMSVERAQRFVTKSFNQRIRTFNSLDLDPDANYFCLVSGKTSHTKSIGGPLNIIILWLFQKFISEHEDQLIGILAIYVYIIYGCFFGLRYLFSNLLPFGLLSTLTFGEVISDWQGSYDYPSNGWVYTIGINGCKIYEGSFWGAAGPEVWAGLLLTLFSGALGFTGIKLGFPDITDYTFFLGTAFKLKLIASS